MHIKIRAFAAALGLIGAGLVGAQTASAATAAPTVKMTQPTFAGITADGGKYPSNWFATGQFHWTVTAAAGVCAQSVTYSDSSTYPGSQTDIISNNAARYDNFGEEFIKYYLRASVSVTDCHGVTATSNTVNVVLQPGDNADSQMSYYPYVASPGIGSRAWATANCTCFLGGSSYWTTLKGASVSFVTPQPNDATGVRVALLMPEGPGRGSAALYVDNVYKATINTYHAGSNINGVINYQFLLTGTNTHLVRIVNLATAGHPRIDIDATINGG